MDIKVVSTFCLLCIILPSIFMLQSFVSIYVFSYLGYIPRSGLADHMVILWITFLGLWNCFHNNYSILHFSKRCVRVLISPHSPQLLLFSVVVFFSIYAILEESLWYLMILLCISLMTKELSSFSCVCGPFICIFERNLYANHLPIS